MSLQDTYGPQTVGVSGCVQGDGPFTVDTGINVAAAQIQPGRAVKMSGSANGVVLPAAEGDAIYGIALESHAFGETYKDPVTGGYLQNAQVAILRRGRVLVQTNTASPVTRGMRLWVRAVAGAPPEYLGQCEGADDSTDMIDCTAQGQFVTDADANGLAVLEVDFINR